MAAEKNNQIVGQSKYDLDAKWDACLDLTVRRFVYSSLAGTFGGLLFFSSFSLSLLNLIFFICFWTQITSIGGLLVAFTFPCN